MFNKKSFSAAVKQVKNIGKNFPIHFHNENNRAYLFTTDGISTAKAYFDTDMSDVLDFCLNTKDFLQICKIRGDFDFNIDNGKIEFFDNKTKMPFAMQDWSGMVDAEKSSVIPENKRSYVLKADELNKVIRGVAYASNPKDTQNPFLTGVNYVLDANGIVKFTSTDRTRIACWESNDQNLIKEDSIETAIFPQVVVENLAFFNPEDNVKIFVEDNKIVLASESFELYCPKVNANCPDIAKFFNQEAVAEYKVNVNEAKASLDIICDDETSTVKLTFGDNSLDISTYSQEMSNSDKIECQKISGGETETSILSPKMLKDVLTKIQTDEITFKLLGNSKLFAYYAGAYYGMIAPKTR